MNLIRKKIFLTVLASLLIVGFTLGCANPPPSTPESSIFSVKDQERYEKSFYRMVDRLEQLKTMVGKIEVRPDKSDDWTVIYNNAIRLFKSANEAKELGLQLLAKEKTDYAELSRYTSRIGMIITQEIFKQIKSIYEQGETK